MQQNSHNSVHHSPAAVTYAQSLLDLATETGNAEVVGEELRDLRQATLADPQYGVFLSNPSISERERREVLERVFRGKVSPLMMNFMGVMNAHGRLGLLTQIAEAYDDLLRRQLGKVEVDVFSAHKLDDEQLEQVRRRVSDALKKDAIVHQYVDESIIGGLVLRVEDRLIDASARYQLAAMKEQLLAARPK